MMLANKLLSAMGEEKKLYVDDVFSTYLYTGNGSTQTINNGIDLAGKGGLVWTKARNSGIGHFLSDTARGAGTYIDTSFTQGDQAAPSSLTAFTPSGFTLGSDAWGMINGNLVNYASWTFRKAPKFFDVVTYTGDGASSRAIAHSLGQEVGMVMTKATSTAGNWNTYHRSATGDLVLNTTAAQTGSKALVNSATTSTFTVSGAANTNAVTYVAYLFANDTSADGIVQCGSFTTDASGNATVNLGWEPQFLQLKRSSTAGGWWMFDSMRGMPVGSADSYLLAESSAAEGSIEIVTPNATGFSVSSMGVSVTVIYLAIRRPNKPPTSGTQVYNAIARTGTGAAATVTGVGFAPDLVLAKLRSFAGGALFEDRMRGADRLLMSYSTSAESVPGDTILGFDVMDGVRLGTDLAGYINTPAAYINHFFKRATGFFDIVCYKGTGVARTVNHNLGVVPELMIVKRRDGASAWFVGFEFTTSNMSRAYLDQTNGKVNATYAAFGAGGISGQPTGASFPLAAGVGELNTSSNTLVAYLFASLPGVSKVGAYTGNGTTQTIDCGFTTGSRFILIKRTNSTGDWYVWDSTRGIVAGNDPHLSLNTIAAEVTSDDSVDPDSSGFIVNQLAATNINVNNAAYLYLAFA